MFLSMLYKRTATGAVQTWVIEVEGDQKQPFGILN